MSTVMQLENVYRLYRMGQETISAVDGISLTVESGEILCLQGPSGSGKSTLLHMMAGLDRPSKGAIILGRTHIEKLTEDRLALFRQRHVGFIFQSYYLIPTLTALENVTMPLMFAGIPARKRMQVAKELLESVGLKDRMRHKPSQMSGGQQQRVSIARAFANNPKIVFADEPTGNLDTHTTYEMMNLMTHLARERNQTLVIVTHDLEISSYASRLVKIRDGRIEAVEVGTGIASAWDAGMAAEVGNAIPWHIPDAGPPSAARSPADRGNPEAYGTASQQETANGQETANRQETAIGHETADTNEPAGENGTAGLQDAAVEVLEVKQNTAAGSTAGQGKTGWAAILGKRKGQDR